MPNNTLDELIKQNVELINPPGGGVPDQTALHWNHEAIKEKLQKLSEERKDLQYKQLNVERTIKFLEERIKAAKTSHKQIYDIPATLKELGKLREERRVIEGKIDTISDQLKEGKVVLTGRKSLSYKTGVKVEQPGKYHLLASDKPQSAVRQAYRDVISRNKSDHSTYAAANDDKGMELHSDGSTVFSFPSDRDAKKFFEGVEGLDFLGSRLLTEEERSVLERRGNVKASPSEQDEIQHPVQPTAGMITQQAWSEQTLSSKDDISGHSVRDPTDDTPVHSVRVVGNLYEISANPEAKRQLKQAFQAQFGDDPSFMKVNAKGNIECSFQSDAAALLFFEQFSNAIPKGNRGAYVFAVSAVATGKTMCGYSGGIRGLVITEPYKQIEKADAAKQSSLSLVEHQQRSPPSSDKRIEPVPSSYNIGADTQMYRLFADEVTQSAVKNAYRVFISRATNDVGMEFLPDGTKFSFPSDAAAVSFFQSVARIPSLESGFSVERNPGQILCKKEAGKSTVELASSININAEQEKGLKQSGLSAYDKAVRAVGSVGEDNKQNSVENLDNGLSND